MHGRLEPDFLSRSLVVRCVAAISLATLILPSCGTSEANQPVPAVVLELPIRGEWKSLRSPGHDEFAFDLAATGGSGSDLLRKSRLHHLLGRTTVEDSYSWSRTVYAPASGTIVAASDGWPDRERLHLIRDAAALLFSRPRLDPEDLRPFAGNYVILRVDSVHVFLAHLRSGSLAVARGDRIEAGQALGQVGNSGQSLMPHLHLEVFDQTENLLKAHSLPFHARRYDRWTGEEWEARRSAPLPKGDRIRVSP
jgi:hypothetical protein